MFANRISSSTSCSIWLPETSPPTSARGVLRHRFQSCNTSRLPDFEPIAYPVERKRAGCGLVKNPFASLGTQTPAAAERMCGITSLAEKVFYTVSQHREHQLLNRPITW